MSAVGYRSTQVGNLQWSSSNFPLPDSNTNHSQSVPAPGWYGLS